MHESVPSLGELNFGENKINQSRALLKSEWKEEPGQWIEENDPPCETYWYKILNFLLKLQETPNFNGYSFKLCIGYFQKIINIIN